MWNRHTKKGEVLPWYRAPDYKGKMTEAEKQSLNSFRAQEKHPTATSDDLPEEGQLYISRLELDLSHRKQDKLTGRALAVSLAGAALLCISYFGLPFSEPWSYLLGAALLIGPWLVYRYEWNKNVEKFLPRELEPGTLSATDEGLRHEWEANYIADTRMQEREKRGRLI